MSDKETDVFDWIYKQEKNLIFQLQEWASISSGSRNIKGLQQMQEVLEKAFGTLQGEMQVIPLSANLIHKGGGKKRLKRNALHITKYPKARFKVLLGGHMDTVYAASSRTPVEFLKPHLLKGPGVADMKGGLLILLTALQALEKSSLSGKIGWEVVINPDEEIGSPSSAQLLKECAKRCHLGLWFEPALPDGTLISARKGSATYLLKVQGRAAHVGRDFHTGRNAITALMHILLDIEKWRMNTPEILLNMGYIEGGTVVNVVPNSAFCYLNVRMESLEAYEQTRNALQKITGHTSEEDTKCLIEEVSFRPPKVWDTKTQKWFSILQQCGQSLNMQLDARPSGGVCDGNLLAAEGLPTIDTLGVVGGGIHTIQEYCDTRSLTERAALTTAFLMHISKYEEKDK
jgi:glutamate carboxypeptidase